MLAELLKKTEKKRQECDARAVTDWRVALETAQGDVPPATWPEAAQCAYCKSWLRTKQQMLRHRDLHPSLIRDANPKIYLGNEANARNFEELKALGVTHVLNCAAIQVELSPEEQSKFSYLGLRLEDNDEQPITHEFEKAFAFLNSSSVAFVHCVQGISRSASFVIAYNMLTNNTALRQAMAEVKDRRLIVQPNRGFLKQLCEFEVKIHGGSSSVALLDWAKKADSQVEHERCSG